MKRKKKEKNKLPDRIIARGEDDLTADESEQAVEKVRREGF